ncbi:putative leucine-rich repeat receptor-like serine/threonine-protein kinase [Vitis vinifera]|uniref:Putative leucine-rich repeat receptor-like serine/threonine-protein kinase n=1 Tax=Vitis vinifera TaxID=29760 RepID=A0A438H901_VITVI|nr:putative leucine-rich repeat receptor-like serine/threonine-protein kinase [Vitis vinifera]
MVNEPNFGGIWEEADAIVSAIQETFEDWKMDFPAKEIFTALRAVKKRLIDPMKNIRNWGKGDPCTSKWKGIVCKDKNTTDGYLHVNALLLLKMNLSGTLAPELGQLSHLEIM